MASDPTIRARTDSRGTRETVVVVGASGAFGGAITDRLVAGGYDVLAVGRHAAAMAELVERHGDGVVACPADIGDDGAIASIRAALDARHQAVRAVVHGPGLPVVGGVLDAPIADLIEAVDIKVGGLLRLVRAADPHFVDGSRIVAIAGHYGLEPSQYAAAAGTANAALFNVVRQLSLAYGARGITAHAIAPGPSDTERLRRVAEDRARMQGTTPDAVLDAMLSESSIHRFTTPEQVAWAVTMLLDPEAAAMTGSTLMLDSGRRKGLP